MSKLYKAEAVVLRARDCGNGNKLLILYSREYGKVKVMAHGVAKPSSRKRGAVQPFSYTSLLLHRGREIDSVSQCEGLEMFSFLREDLKKISYASYLADLVDALTPEGEPNEQLFALLLATLRLMAGNDVELLTRAFEIRAAALLGYRPVLESCVQCQGPPGGQPFFSPALGGVLCDACAPADPGAFSCSRGVVEFLKVLLTWHPSRLSRLKVDRSSGSKIKSLMKEYLKYYLEKDLKSAAFLDRLSSISLNTDV